MRENGSVAERIKCAGKPRNAWINGWEGKSLPGIAIRPPEHPPQKDIRLIANYENKISKF
jgi:hypothetical protein